MGKESKKQRFSFPKLWQLVRAFEVFSKKEKFLFSLFLVALLVSWFWLINNFYLNNSKEIPIKGGVFREGFVGQPRFISPLYLSDNDPDRDIVSLLFSGLLGYNEKKGFFPKLAKSYQLKDEGKVFEFELRDNLFWSDGKPFTSSDILFTINLIQTPSYKSPLEIEWSGVKVVKEGEKRIRFYLKKKNFAFLETIYRLKIIPEHIYQSFLPENLPWQLTSKKYLIGTGPFKIKEIQRNPSGFIEKIILEENENYFGKKPYLKEIELIFFKSFKELILAAKRGEIDGFSWKNSQENYNFPSNFRTFRFVLPRYFAIFYNLKKRGILKKVEIREALSRAINRREIIEKVFSGNAKAVFSPFVEQFYNLKEPTGKISFDRERAEEILENEGFKLDPTTKKRVKKIIISEGYSFKNDLQIGNKGKEVRELQKCLAKFKDVYPDGQITGYFGPKTKKAVILFQEKYKKDILEPVGLKRGTGKVGKMTRKKLNQLCAKKEEKKIPLEITITTIDSFPLKEISEIVKKSWEQIGVKVKLHYVSLAEFETNILKEKNYQVLIFGQSLARVPDLFAFWHSSQGEYPGLNLSLYNSKIADKILEQLRESNDLKERKEKIIELREKILKDIPAHFLVSPEYIYLLSDKIKGVEFTKISQRAERFLGIENWYLKTKRIFNWKF